MTALILRILGQVRLTYFLLPMEDALLTRKGAHGGGAPEVVLTPNTLQSSGLGAF